MKTELTYHREGEYLIPDLILPESPRIGVWGIRRRDCLRKYHDGIYTVHTWLVHMKRASTHTG